MALMVRKAPSIAVPKPAPATAVPARRAGADAVWIAARVSTAPATKARQPASIAAGPAKGADHDRGRGPNAGEQEDHQPAPQ